MKCKPTHMQYIAYQQSVNFFFILLRNRATLDAELKLHLDVEMDDEKMIRFMIHITKLTDQQLYDTLLIHHMHALIKCVRFFLFVCSHSSLLTPKQLLDTYLRAKLFAIKSIENSHVRTVFDRHWNTIRTWPLRFHKEDIDG